MTLGKLRGTLWIGQPLELAIPIGMDADQSASDLCPQVEVLHGDTRQDSNLVHITIEPGSHPDNLTLRVRSAAKVDEHVVTLNLRLGCTQKTAHRLVLLADYPSTSNSSVAAAVPAPVTAAASAPAPAKRPHRTKPAPHAALPAEPPERPSFDGIELTLASSLSAESLSLHALGKHASHKHPAADSAPQSVEMPETKSHRSRLKLDPVETLSDRVAQLESGNTTPEAVNPIHSAEAQQLEALQGDLKSLIEQASKNEIAMAAMRERLERSESDRGPVILAYSLLTLIALTLLGALLLWARRYLPRLGKKNGAEVDADLD